MKRILLAALAALSLVSLRAASPAPNVKNVPDYLQDISATITTGQGSGSGVIFTRKNAKGETVNFVWTAGHVVDGLRKTRSVVASDGTERIVVEFDDAQVLKELRENGRIVGRIQFDAAIVKYSDAQDGDDLALLMIRKRGFVETTAFFYLDDELLPLGTELYHVGSLSGELGANSLTTGIISQTGRLIYNRVFDQTTVVAIPGSSGGGVFLKDGRYVGMLTRGGAVGFNFIVPTRRIQEFAKRAKVEWAINPSIALPTQEEIDKLPIEDNGSTRAAFERAAAKANGASRSGSPTALLPAVPVSVNPDAPAISTLPANNP